MREQKLSDELCKNIIRNLALKYGIPPRLITTRLMSEEDKNDMRQGQLPIETLEAHVKLWIQEKFPDYAHGFTEPMENPPVPKPAQRSRPY